MTLKSNESLMSIFENANRKYRIHIHNYMLIIKTIVPTIVYVTVKADVVFKKNSIKFKLFCIKY